MFTDIFVEILQEKGVTPYQVAKNTGISQGLMGEYKKGIKMPTISNLIKIADYLDCSVDYLLGRSDNPNMVNSINNANAIVTGTQSNVIGSTLPSDEMSTELLKAFNNLSFEDKLDFLSKIIAKSKEK